MNSERENTGNSPHLNNSEFTISRIYLARLIFGLVLTVGLSFSLIMAELSYHVHPRFSHDIHAGPIIVPYLLMLLFVIIIVTTTILTARKIKVNETGIEINNLFWCEKSAWKDLRMSKSANHLRFSWLRTKRFLYILAKNEFKHWAELEKSLQEHISNH